MTAAGTGVRPQMTGPWHVYAPHIAKIVRLVLRVLRRLRDGSGTRGRRLRDSIRTNEAGSRAATTNSTTVETEAQPRWGAYAIA
ncbi:hypothetical protein ACFWDI_09420 [Streptomyces sp. NPDC060064]|uniref:hypothetical protein n=1 Tax=Streptomyces sp. NPDC060064 TaxID=3347049 RepID=UPI0036AB40C1